MAELSTIGRPYAEALFQSARSSGQPLDQWLKVVEEWGSLLAHPQVAEVVADPKLNDDAVFNLLSGLASATRPTGADNFLKVVIANQRLAALPEVARQFRQLKNEAEGVAECLIESAFPMDEARVDELLRSLSKRLGRTLRPTVAVDRELIGGVRITVGDRVLDGSVRAQLQNMQAALTA